MDSIKTRSFSRAGFLGNPSDGYFGKTMLFAFSDLKNEPWPQSCCTMNMRTYSPAVGIASSSTQP